jgi:hypothetical protein
VPFVWVDRGDAQRGARPRRQVHRLAELQRLL